MIQYLNLLRNIQELGDNKGDRTGTGTCSLFGAQLRFDLRQGFPLLTTKKMFTKAVLYELLWFLRGDTNIKYLNDHGVTIWDEWADEKGNLGPVYGHQWRNWPAGLITKRKSDMTPSEVVLPFYPNGGWATPSNPEETCTFLGEIDQITQALNRLQKDPMSRRHIVTAWNPADVDKMALPPCHCLFQFNCAEIPVGTRMGIAFKEGRNPGFETSQSNAEVHDQLDKFGVPRYYIDCQLYQRSADVFLGVPFNIASYAALTHMFGHVLNMVPRYFIHSFGDVHIYNNHKDQVREQLSREPRKLPTLTFKPDTPKDLFAIDYEHFVITGYDPHPAISAPVAV